MCIFFLFEGGELEILGWCFKSTYTDTGRGGVLRGEVGKRVEGDGVVSRKEKIYMLMAEIYLLLYSRA